MDLIILHLLHFAMYTPQYFLSDLFGILVCTKYVQIFEENDDFMNMENEPLQIWVPFVSNGNPKKNPAIPNAVTTLFVATYNCPSYTSMANA